MGGMEISCANMGVDDNGGNVDSSVPRPPSPSRPRPSQSTLHLLLPRIGCIRTGVDDTGGLIDGPREIDASWSCPAMLLSSSIWCNTDLAI